MKTIIKTSTLTALMFLSLLLTNCSSSVEPETQTLMTSEAAVSAADLSSVISGMELEDLSDAEIEGLLYMREEEKLARDVYLKFFELYGSAVFSNIAAGEQRHTDAVKLLIDRYGLTDPVSEDVQGQFVNTDLQDLYNTLIGMGEISLIDGLQTGALIEEVDILDLINESSNIVDNQDILLVYENLKNGSYNHLRAFVNNLAANGVTYTPQRLDGELYNEILSSASGNGRRGRR